MHSLKMIAARSVNGVIGVSNTLPWRLMDDLKAFKRATLGKAVVMGRKTYESIGKPLPGRLNVVLTRDPDFIKHVPDGVVVLHTKAQVLALAAVCPVVVIGGGEIYRLFLEHATELMITEVDTHAEGDTTFPELDPERWHQLWSEMHQKREGVNDHDFRIVSYLPI